MAVYVLQVRALSEVRMMDELRELGFEVWTPIARKWKRSPTGRRVLEERALARGCLFLATCDIAAIYPVMRTRRRIEGVLGRESPVPLSGDSAAWVVRVMLAEAAGAFDYTGDRRPKCSLGQMVRLVSGAFRGHTGTLAAIGPRAFQVKLEGRFVKGKVSVSKIELEDGEVVEA